MQIKKNQNQDKVIWIYFFLIFKLHVIERNTNKWLQLSVWQSMSDFDIYKIEYDVSYKHDCIIHIY